MYPTDQDSHFKWPNKEDIQAIDEKFVIFVLDKTSEPCPTGRDARAYWISGNCIRLIEEQFVEYKQCYFN